MVHGASVLTQRTRLAWRESAAMAYGYKELSNTHFLSAAGRAGNIAYEAWYALKDCGAY